MLSEISLDLIFRVFSQNYYGLFMIIGVIALPFLYIIMPIRLFYVLFRIFKPNEKYFLKNYIFIFLSYLFLFISIIFVFDSWNYLNGLETGAVSGLFVPMLSVTPFLFYLGFEFFRFISFKKVII